MLFFLECVEESADDGVETAQKIFALTDRDRRRLTAHPRATVAAIQLLDVLPSHPMITVPGATELIGSTPPTTRKAVELLADIGILRETSGRQRDRVYAYHGYLQALTADE